MRNLLKKTELQSHQEEISNALSHLFGALLSIAGLVVMIIKAANMHSSREVISASLFGSALVGMYLSSTFYHLSRDFKIKKKLQVIDHACIYFLIAGTYTPFTLVTLSGAWGWSLFGVVWGCALMGIIFKLFFTGRFEKISVAFYVLMGWVAIIAIKPLVSALSLPGTFWLVSGGLLYTFGTIFYMADTKYKYAHTIWHLFVLAGSFCHFICVYGYVL